MKIKFLLGIAGLLTLALAYFQGFNDGYDAIEKELIKQSYKAVQQQNKINQEISLYESTYYYNINPCFK